MKIKKKEAEVSHFKNLRLHFGSQLNQFTTHEIFTGQNCPCVFSTKYCIFVSCRILVSFSIYLSWLRSLLCVALVRSKLVAETKIQFQNYFNFFLLSDHLHDDDDDDDSDDEENPLVHFLLGGFRSARQSASSRTRERPEVLSKPVAKSKYSFIENLINM